MVLIRTKFYRGVGVILVGSLLALGTPGVLWASEAIDFWQADLEEAEFLSKAKVGWVSWYGGKFHGRKTANGERYNKYAFTCASKTLPFGTVLEIQNLKNGKIAVARVNDRGPYRKRRVLDVSYAVAKKLGMVSTGVAKVAYQTLYAPRK